MVRLLKHAYEPLIILVLYLLFYLTVKGHLIHTVYYVAATLGALYFVPLKAYNRVYNDSPHKKLYVISAVLVFIIIVLSAVRIYTGRNADLKTVARVLFYLNIVVMLYSFFKAVEGRDYVVHFALLFLTNEMIDRF